MNEKFPRRSLLTTLGAAALVGTGCDRKSEPTAEEKGKEKGKAAAVAIPLYHRVNVICHGMMVFWSDRGEDPRKFYIMLPDTGNTHEVILSESLGGQNLLSGKGNYEIDFKLKSQYDFKKREPEENVVLYDKDGTKQLKHQSTGAHWHIKLPYTCNVRGYRKMTFPMPPYSGKTQETFEIHPATMFGVHVLTYDDVDSEVKLRRPIGFADTLTEGIPTVLNLHLYCEKRTKPTPGSKHLHHLRKLLSHKDLSQTSLPELDLKVVENNTPSVVKLEEEIVPDDLSRYDLASLYELNSGSERLLSPEFLLVDPAECLQGWGS